MSWDQYAALVAFNMAFLGVGFWGGYKLARSRAYKNGLRKGAEITARLTNELSPTTRDEFLAAVRRMNDETSAKIKEIEKQLTP